MTANPTMSIEEAGLLFKSMKDDYQWIRRQPNGTLILAKKLPQSEMDEPDSNLALYPYPYLYGFIDDDSDWFRIKSLFKNVCINPNLDEQRIVMAQAIFKFSINSIHVSFIEFPEVEIIKETFEEALLAAYIAMGKNIYEENHDEIQDKICESANDQESNVLILDMIMDMQLWEYKHLKKWDA